MFGKPEWFRPKTFGWGLTPVTWQGWVYTLVVAAVLVVPFNLLLHGGRHVEAFVWMAAALALVFYDVALILRKMRQNTGGQNRRSD